MDRKIIPFPSSKNNGNDPAALRQADYEWEELVSTIPQAAPAAPKFMY